MNSDQIHKNHRTAASSAQLKKSSTPPRPTPEDQQLASLLSEQGIKFPNGCPSIFEMLAFEVGYCNAMKGQLFEVVISKLECLADLIAENPRMVPLRDAILSMAKAEQILSKAMGALNKI